MFDRLRAAALSRAQDGTGGGAAGPCAGRLRISAGLEHVTTEFPDGVGRLDAEQPCGLRIQVADVALLVDGVHTFDHRVEHHLRLGFALPQLRVDIDQVAAHVVHGACQLPDFRGSGGGYRRREVALAETHRRIGKCLGGTRDAPPEQHPGNQRQQREYHGGDDQTPDQRAHGAIGIGRGSGGFDQRHALAGRRQDRKTGCIQSARLDPLHRESSIGERL